MSRSCAIFGGGESVSLETVNNELVGDELMIAADGYTPTGEGLIPDTDLMLAIKHGISEGCSRFVFF